MIKNQILKIILWLVSLLPYEVILFDLCLHNRTPCIFVPCISSNLPPGMMYDDRLGLERIQSQIWPSFLNLHIEGPDHFLGVPSSDKGFVMGTKDAFNAEE